ncbi:hypothetical protein [Nocardia sp. NPDC056000]|uniref:hypothetical protein n=1 Tax=Nocardia sp. NPDC056000 TaxID=3345674 RepID=UPI0035E2D0A2
MPDTNAMRLQNFGEQYYVAPVLEQGYRTLPKTFATTFNSFGVEPATPPPTKSDPPRIETPALSGLQSTGIANYQDLLSRLRTSFTNLKAANAVIAPVVKDTAATGDAAQDNINTIILGMKESAKQVPPGTTTENQWVMTLITQVTDDLTAVVSDAKEKLQQQKGEIDAAAKTIADQKDLIAKLQAQVDGKAGDPPPAGTPPGTTGNPYTPPPFDSGSLIDGLLPKPNDGSTPPVVTPTPDPTKPPGSDGTTPPGSTPDPSTDPSGDLPTPTPQNPAPPDTSSQYPNMASPAGMGGMGSGMDPMSMMLPSLMSAMQNPMNDRYQADPDRYNEDPYDRYPQNAVPVQASPAAVTPQAPATTPPSTTTTPPATTDKPANPAPPAAAAPAPDADGGVDYPFPDGKTQRVSVIVAKALDKAFGNKKGTDAQAAYADTSAKWSDNKQIGDRVDPSQLMTGDVGIWENPDLVAIVRAMGSDAEASLDVIVNGELRRYPDQVSETSGELGKFVGWAHPRGIEITGTSAKHGDGPVPGIGAPAAPLPVVAAPAS